MFFVKLFEFIYTELYLFIYWLFLYLSINFYEFKLFFTRFDIDLICCFLLLTVFYNYSSLINYIYISLLIWLYLNYYYLFLVLFYYLNNSLFYSQYPFEYIIIKIISNYLYYFHIYSNYYFLNSIKIIY
jgi:hypothetical protein